MVSDPLQTPTSPIASNARILVWTIGCLLCLLAWDASGLDLALARWFGGTQGFPLREHWFTVGVMHELARRLAWALVAVLALSIWFPWGTLRGISRAARIQWVVSTLLALLLVSSIKHASATSCPWDLAEFGGPAQYVSHWAWGVWDGGGGKCFPAGHASAGFAFLGGYFALRPEKPRPARSWWLFAVFTGLLLGFAQQVRGAHYMSHTLWTGWLCWTCGWLIDIAFRSLQRLLRRPAPSSASDAAL